MLARLGERKPARMHIAMVTGSRDNGVIEYKHKKYEGKLDWTFRHSKKGPSPKLLPQNHFGLACGAKDAPVRPPAHA